MSHSAKTAASGQEDPLAASRCFGTFDRSFGQKKGAASRLPIDSSIFCCKTNTVMTVLIQTSIVYRIFGEEKEVFTTDGCKRKFFVTVHG